MNQTTHIALLAESLYSKSQVYISRGLRAKNDNVLDEYQLWSSLSLELLAKSSLSTIHPALIADPLHYQSLFAACGKTLSPNIKTITAKTLFERLGHISNKFDQRLKDFCIKLSIRRNSELHSGESPFMGMNPDAWEREFWYAVQVILGLQEKDLDAWLGVEGSSVPKQLLLDAENALNMAVKERINKTNEDFLRANKNKTKRDEIIEESRNVQIPNFSNYFKNDIDKFELYQCPACSAMGILGGALADSELTDDEHSDPFWAYVRNIYSAEEFYCHICTLHLVGEREINAANIPNEFEKIEEEEEAFDFFPDYGND